MYYLRKNEYQWLIICGGISEFKYLIWGFENHGKVYIENLKIEFSVLKTY